MTLRKNTIDNSVTNTPTTKEIQDSKPNTIKLDSLSRKRNKIS